MVMVEMSLDAECLLRQMAADLDRSPSDLAQVLLESLLLTPVE